MTEVALVLFGLLTGINLALFGIGWWDRRRYRAYVAAAERRNLAQIEQWRRHNARHEELLAAGEQPSLLH